MFNLVLGDIFIHFAACEVFGILTLTCFENEIRYYALLFAENIGIKSE
jgi:hypothetical protein